MIDANEYLRNRGLSYIKITKRQCGYCSSAHGHVIQNMIHVPIFANYHDKKRIKNGSLCILVPICSICGKHVVKIQDEIILEGLDESYVMNKTATERLSDEEILFQLKKYFNPFSDEISIQAKRYNDSTKNRAKLILEQGTKVPNKLPNTSFTETDINDELMNPEPTDESEYDEGNIVMKTHQVRERNPEVVRNAKKLFKKIREVFSVKHVGLISKIFTGNEEMGLLKGITEYLYQNYPNRTKQKSKILPCFVQIAIG